MPWEPHSLIGADPDEVMSRPGPRPAHDLKTRLRRASRWHRLSSESGLCGAYSGDSLGDHPLGLRPSSGLALGPGAVFGQMRASCSAGSPPALAQSVPGAPQLGLHPSRLGRDLTSFRRGLTKARSRFGPLALAQRRLGSTESGPGSAEVGRGSPNILARDGPSLGGGSARFGPGAAHLAHLDLGPAHLGRAFNRTWAGLRQRKTWFDQIWRVAPCMAQALAVSTALGCGRLARVALDMIALARQRHEARLRRLPRPDVRGSAHAAALLHQRAFGVRPLRQCGAASKPSVGQLRVLKNNQGFGLGWRPCPGSVRSAWNGN